MEDLVHVYRNLHKKCYSIREKGRVVAHREIVLIEGAKFVVQPAGHAKVLREKRKNVHAYVKGKWTVLGPGRAEWHMKHAKQVRYNPYQMDCFFYSEDHEPIYAAHTALLTPKGVYVI